MRKSVFAYVKTNVQGFPFIDIHVITIPLLPKFKPLAIFCGCTARFESDLVGTPENRFSRDEAQLS